MGFQPDYGHILGISLKAGEDLPYYRFVEIKGNTIVLGSGKNRVLGVTLPSAQDYAIKSDGTTQKRDGYLKGEQPQLMNEGVAYVKLGGLVTVGDRVTCGADGNAVKHENTEEDIVGISLDSKKEGEFGRILLKIR